MYLNNYKQILINMDYITVIQNLGIGVLSAMVLILTIDKISEKNKKEEMKRQNLIVYNKIKPHLNHYYDFYVKLYIATRKENLKYNEPVLKSLFNDKSNFINNIIKSKPFYKEGMYADGSIDMLSYFQTHKTLPKTLPWYKCWFIDTEKFYNEMIVIQNYYCYFMPTEFIVLLEELLKSIKYINSNGYICNLVSQFGIENAEKCISTEIIIKEFCFEEILDKLKNVIEFIENETEISIQERDINFYNQTNVNPTIGSVYKKDYNRLI